MGFFKSRQKKIRRALMNEPVYKIPDIPNYGFVVGDPVKIINDDSIYEVVELFPWGMFRVINKVTKEGYFIQGKFLEPYDEDFY